MTKKNINFSGESAHHPTRQSLGVVGLAAARKLFPRFNRNTWVAVTLAVPLVASMGIAYYFYAQNQSLKINSPDAAQAEAQALISRVGKIMLLPEGETPTVATVKDLEALKDQPFFAKAAVGDKILIYNTARRAILYSPTSNRIIEVAPLNIKDQQTGEPQAEEESQATQETGENGAGE